MMACSDEAVYDVLRAKAERAKERAPAWRVEDEWALYELQNQRANSAYRAGRKRPLLTVVSDVNR